MIEVALFTSTFFLVFALGLQSLNVNGGHYAAAFINSFVIGTSNLALFRYMPDPSATQVAAYLCGGPFGIVTSMWFHQRFRRWWADWRAQRTAQRDARRGQRPPKAPPAHGCAYPWPPPPDTPPARNPTGRADTTDTH